MKATTTLPGSPAPGAGCARTALAALLFWPCSSVALEVMGVDANDTTVTLLFLIQAFLLLLVWLLYRQQLKLTRLLTVESRTDSLTLIPNRRHFFETLESAIALADRHGQPLSVFIFDLDDFKKINDTYGHAAGDKVLRKVSAAVQRNIRQTDCLGRVGGEEFAVQLPYTSGESARMLAERIRARVEALTFPEISDDLRVTCSIGLAAFRPGLSSDRLLELADDALYEAKQAGKNCVRALAAGVDTPTGAAAG